MNLYNLNLMINKNFKINKIWLKISKINNWTSFISKKRFIKII